ncbi:MAG TPA: S9 family peptidase [Candidatus Xenobia bacterium]|jgi:dipeptidyl aminopeptidase/acylaminoacyl peptidase
MRLLGSDFFCGRRGFWSVCRNPSASPFHQEVTPIRYFTPETLYEFKTVDDPQWSNQHRLAFTVIEVDRSIDSYRTHVEGLDGPLSGPHHSAPRWSPDGTGLATISRAEGKPRLMLGDRALSLPYRWLWPATWSPDGTQLLYAALVPLADRPATAPRRIVRSAYKEDGLGDLSGEATHLFVVDLESGSTRQLTTGEAHHPYATWSPDGSEIALVRTRTGALDGLQTDLWIMAADGSGERQVTSDIGRAICPAWSPHGIFLYGTQTKEPGDPLMALWVVSTRGEARRLTDERVDVVRSTRPNPTAPPRWSPNGDVYFMGTLEGGRHLLRWDGREVARAVPHACVTSYSIDWESGRIAYAAMDPHSPSELFVGTDKVTRLNDLSDIAMPTVVERTFDTPHGPRQGWVVGYQAEHPSTCSAISTPLLVNVHGGPHAWFGSEFPVHHYEAYVMAGLGWTVLSLNPTGSGSFGRELALGARGQWGEFDTPEHHAAIDRLVADGRVDPHQVSVVGYSYGGFMAAWMTSHSGRFQAAVVAGAVTNVEAFVGTADIGSAFMPFEMDAGFFQDRERFRRLSPIQYVQQVTTPTLVLHGEADDRVPVGQGEEWYLGLLMAGRVPCEFVRYPGASHMFFMYGRPSHRVDYTRRIVDWLERYGQKREATPVGRPSIETG